MPLLAKRRLRSPAVHGRVETKAKTNRVRPQTHQPMHSRAIRATRAFPQTLQAFKPLASRAIFILASVEAIRIIGSRPLARGMQGLPLPRFLIQAPKILIAQNVETCRRRYESQTNWRIMVPSFDQTALLFGHGPPQCCIQNWVLKASVF